MSKGKTFINSSFQLDSEKLHHIVEHIVKTLKPRKIILFGSRAEWRAREESDVDLLVVLDFPIDRSIKWGLSSQISKEVGVYVQLIPIVAEQYEETKDIIGGIAYPATRYGFVIYEDT